ncbi:MAG: arsinothricin resistance N-acetyltransferase ArsN1 family B [Gammaproteobacteria bacterium]
MSNADRIRAVTLQDAAAIARIYNHYIVNTTVSFEEDAVAVAERRERIAEAAAQNLPFLVAEREGAVVGYANATKWKGRCAYRYSVETGIYLAPDGIGQGIGTPLYQTLLAALRERGVHAMIAGIALPNPASIALHEKCGFVKIGQFREVGFKFGRWIDVGYWELVCDPDCPLPEGAGEGLR